VYVSSEMMAELGLEDVSLDGSNPDSGDPVAADATTAHKPPDSARVSSYFFVLCGSDFFSADRMSGRAFSTLLCPSVCRLSVCNICVVAKWYVHSEN